MRFLSSHSSDESGHGSVKRSSTFFVPLHRTALVIRNGVPEQFYPPGLHDLPPGQAKVEVRLLSEEASRLPDFAPPGPLAQELPFERSLLHVDGELVGIVKPPRADLAASASTISTWEASHFSHLEALLACLAEPLRTCAPVAGICCGGRLAA
jgi:hypothetical protein